jgi:di/tricarboxylate transporter
MTVRATENMPRAPYIVGIRDSNKLRLEPPGGDVIPVGATLALLGSPEHVKAFTRQFKLKLKPNLTAFVEALNPSRSGVSEVVLPPGSNLLGKTIIDIQLRRNYGASLLALYRNQETIRTDLRSQKLRAGDTLVLHSSWADLYSLSQDRNFVVVTDFPRDDAARADKAKYALSFFALALGLIVFADLRLSVALLAGAVGMMLCRVLTVDEAYKAISWQTVFLLAGLIPLGMAVDTSGTATWIAEEILLLFGDLPHWMLQTAVAILATFFTLLISNVAATVLLVPLAVNIAIGVGANPAIFALTVALATSNSFFIPTNQVNALVMGPAGYRVADFIRAGGIMTILYLVVMISVLNLFY